jgi:hypothetical protein
MALRRASATLQKIWREGQAEASASYAPHRDGDPRADLEKVLADRAATLSKLAVWWLRLGIALERIKPGHPQQNSRDERMHLTLKKEATRPPGMNTCSNRPASTTSCSSSMRRGQPRPSP